MPEIRADHLSALEQEFLERLLGEDLPDGESGAANLVGLTPLERWWLWTRVVGGNPVLPDLWDPDHEAPPPLGVGLALLQISEAEAQTSIWAGKLARTARHLATGTLAVVTTPSTLAADILKSEAARHGLQPHPAHTPKAGMAVFIPC